MRHLKFTITILISFLFLNSCSKEEDSLPCPQTENISMKINGEEMQFRAMAWGIVQEPTLELEIAAGVFAPQHNSWSLSLKLPYKKTGNNLIEELLYTRVINSTTVQGYFEPGDLQSQVTVNTKNCISLTFSGRIVIDGNEIVITDGIINYVYPKAFGSF